MKKLLLITILSICANVLGQNKIVESDEKIVVTFIHPTYQLCDDYDDFNTSFKSLEPIWEKTFGDIDFETLENNSVPYSTIEVKCENQKKVFTGLRRDSVSITLKELRGIE